MKLTRKALRDMPKVELHRHLDGSIRFETIIDLARRHNLDLITDSEENLRQKTKITVHSGENTSADHVQRSLDLFKPDRIGHGIKIWGNEALMKRIRESEILLEVCPTSNWITRSVPSLEDHPLPHLYREKIPVSINSDDPHLFDIDLIHEYEICMSKYGLNLEDFMEINKNAVEHSFLDTDIKAYVLKAF